MGLSVKTVLERNMLRYKIAKKDVYSISAPPRVQTWCTLYPWWWNTTTLNIRILLHRWRAVGLYEMKNMLLQEWQKKAAFLYLTDVYWIVVQVLGGDRAQHMPEWLPVLPKPIPHVSNHMIPVWHAWNCKYPIFQRDQSENAWKHYAAIREYVSTCRARWRA